MERGFTTDPFWILGLSAELGLLSGNLLLFVSRRRKTLNNGFISLTRSFIATKFLTNDRGEETPERLSGVPRPLLFRCRPIPRRPSAVKHTLSLDSN